MPPLGSQGSILIFNCSSPVLRYKKHVDLVWSGQNSIARSLVTPSLAVSLASPLCFFYDLYCLLFSVFSERSKSHLVCCFIWSTGSLPILSSSWTCRYSCNTEYSPSTLFLYQWIVQSCVRCQARIILVFLRIKVHIYKLFASGFLFLIASLHRWLLLEPFVCILHNLFMLNFGGEIFGARRSLSRDWSWRREFSCWLGGAWYFVRIVDGFNRFHCRKLCF